LYTPAYTKDPHTGRLVKSCTTKADSYCNENPLYGSYYQRSNMTERTLEPYSEIVSTTAGTHHVPENHSTQLHVGHKGENLTHSQQPIINMVQYQGEQAHGGLRPANNVVYGERRVISTRIKRVDPMTGFVLSEEVMDGEYNPDLDHQKGQPKGE
jgi:hypothetical protein